MNRNDLKGNICSGIVFLSAFMTAGCIENSFGTAAIFTAIAVIATIIARWGYDE